MADFTDAIFELLPLRSNLHHPNNQLRKVLSNTVGEWFDRNQLNYEDFFLNTATGGYLDLFGADYGVLRNIDETDDSYRQRIIQEKNDHLTPTYLRSLYGLNLYTYVTDFDANNNDLTSDNPYIVMGNGFMAEASAETQDLLNNKFILDNVVLWLIDGRIDYIINTSNINVIQDYSNIYGLTDCRNYFNENNTVKNLRLNLPNATNCEGMISECGGLTSVNLSLPNATNCGELFFYCPNLTNVTLDLPEALACYHMFMGCEDLTSISLSLPKAWNCQQLLSECDSLVEVDLDLPLARECDMMFYESGALEELTLTLPSATNCFAMCSDCISLKKVDLNLPSATNCSGLFYYSNYNPNDSVLEEVKISMPSMSSFDNIFTNNNAIKTIDVTIPTNKINDFKTYVLGLELANLTSFKINGEEVDLS